MIRIIALSLAILMATTACSLADTITINSDTADFDRWFYDQNTTPGISARGSVFSDANTRLAQSIIGFDTSEFVPTSMGAANYGIVSARLTMTTFISARFLYDATYDPIQTYINPNDDIDPGRPVVLFGAAVRNGLTGFGFGDSDPEDAIFQENESHFNCIDDEAPECFSPNAYATDFDGFQTRDIFSNVSEGFDVAPWSIAQTTGAAPGDEITSPTEFTFTIDLQNPFALQYLQESLDDGRLFLNLSSLTLVDQMAPSGFPSYYLREGEGAPGFGFPTLDLEVEILDGLIGDFNGDQSLDCLDVDSLVSNIAAMTHDPVFDLNGDLVVNGADLDEWLVVAGAENLASGGAYKKGDANLDGLVDGLDFIEWNDNKFTAVAAWCSGDFNADGLVDGQDFIEWNANKFTSSDGLAVPEPTIGLLGLLTIAGAFARWRR